MGSLFGCGIIASGLMGALFGGAIGSGFGYLGTGALIGSFSGIVFILIYSRRARGRIRGRQGDRRRFMTTGLVNKKQGAKGADFQK